MTTQDSDNVKAIKALEDVEKHLKDVTAAAQRGARWAWQHDGVTYIDVFGFQDMTNRAGKTLEDAAPLFEVYLHALGKVPPRFKAVFEHAAALMDWVRSLEYQHEAEYYLVRGLQRLQRVESGLQDLCTQPVEAAAHQKTKPKSKESKAATRLQSQELQEVKAKLIAAGIIKDGVWQGTPAEFGCLVNELRDERGISNHGRRAWEEVISWAGYRDNKESARSAIEKHIDTEGDVADKIRAICLSNK